MGPMSLRPTHAPSPRPPPRRHRPLDQVLRAGQSTGHYAGCWKGKAEYSFSPADAEKIMQAIATVTGVDFDYVIRWTVGLWLRGETHDMVHHKNKEQFALQAENAVRLVLGKLRESRGFVLLKDKLDIDYILSRGLPCIDETTMVMLMNAFLA